MGLKIAPSLMCMDLLNVQKQIKILEKKSAYFHVDIIDWHYVKNFSLAPCFMNQVKTITSVPMDAHLMVDNVDTDLVEYCIETGASVVTLPADAIGRRAFRLIDEIKQAGKKAGVYINPSQKLDDISMYIHLLDKITIMTVDPGYAGQKFIRESLQKIKQAKDLKEKKRYTYEIEIDGSCNKKTYSELYNSGAEVFIVGSSGLFSLDTDLEKAWAKMEKNLIEAIGSKGIIEYDRK